MTHEPTEYAERHELLLSEYWAKRAPVTTEYNQKLDALYAEFAAQRAALDAEHEGLFPSEETP